MSIDGPLEVLAAVCRVRDPAIATEEDEPCAARGLARRSPVRRSGKIRASFEGTEMTTAERERMNSLCLRIQEEKDHQSFEALLRELDEVIAHKQRRFPQGDGIVPWQGRTRPWKMLSGSVQKTVKSVYRNGAETVEIIIPKAEDLFRELRIENAFTDVDGQPVALKERAHVDITFEAEARDTVKKVGDGHA